MIKKILTILVLTATTSFAQVAFHQPEEIYSDGLEFTTYSWKNGLWVTNYSGSEKTVVIPRYLRDGREITGIDSSATGFDDVTNLTINCKYIEVDQTKEINSSDWNYIRCKSPFSYNTNLVSVTWTHPDAEFTGYLDDMFTGDVTKMEKEDFGDECRTKSEGPFFACTNLTSFVAPYLKNLPLCTFMFDKKLSNVEIPNIEHIGAQAFRQSGIETFISDTVLIIDKSAFKDCTSLYDVRITSPVKICSAAFRGTTGLQEILFPNVTYIGCLAFGGSTKQYLVMGGWLNTLELPNLKKIERGAFGGSRGAITDYESFTNITTFIVNNASEVLSAPVNTKVLYANSAEKIDLSCNLNALETVFANSLKTIPNKWAQGISTLKTVVAQNAKDIGYRAFSGCTNLGWCNLQKVKTIGKFAFEKSGTLSGGGQSAVGVPGRGMTTFHNCERIDNLAFYRSSIAEVDPKIFPKVVYVGNGAFSGCQNLEEIIFQNAKFIGHNLAGNASDAYKTNSINNKHYFYRPATNLSKIILPSAITIGGSMAANNETLELFHAPTVEKIGGYVIANTPCRTSDRTGNYGLSFPNLQRASSYAFCYATNATDFSAPSLSDVSMGGTWVAGAWTNIYVPLLMRSDPELYEGSDNLQRFITHDNAQSYVPLIPDTNTNKTAVTIGRRLVSTDVGAYSVVQGFNALASGNYSHAEGAGATYNGHISCDANSTTVTLSAAGPLPPTNSYIIYNDTLFTILSANNNTYTVDKIISNVPLENVPVKLTHENGYSHSIRALGNYSHAEGHGTTASGVGSHSEGTQTKASGDYSHSEGTITKALGNYSHAEGTHTTASGLSSHAEGYYTITSNKYSHTDGLYSIATNNSSYVWSGTTNTYYSHGDGTFNIDPTNGPSGFFIGDESLTDHIKKLTYGSQDIFKLGIADGDYPNNSYTIALTNGAIQIFYPAENDDTEIELILPEKDDDIEYGNLTIMIMTDLNQTEHYYFSDENCYPQWFPSTQPWNNNTENYYWKTKWESPPGLTQWYFMGAEKYPY